ncbi:DUF2927 domain-containing protein [Sulfitobacter sp. SK012]|uniref:DUF2927 domain-containing protein n=1 Tax=Sulfitobacter sp. SK012 TaxID=1389005 RepID=UPI0020C82D41|nr:DUF2927 domain-containing protein [Sulfitobacter sp. SK012]
MALSFVMLLAACVPSAETGVTRRAVIAETSLPPVKVFAGEAHRISPRANSDLARDFLDLSFSLENGRALPVFTRFEGPISVTVTGTPLPTMQHDLTRLLERLRNEAGIAITQSSRGPANITIQAVTRDEIRKILPNAACFVAPNVSSLREYRKARRKDKTNWALLRERKKLAIFLPSDVSPQEARDCLHEELAQALGPLNDLYRLPNSVFNDDNVHTVLTGFDMLMLRITYAPELRTGMDRNAVAAALPGILARMNPGGARVAALRVGPTPQAWKQAIEKALGPQTSSANRRNSAARAIQIAEAEGWTDHRLAFSHYAMGRVLQSSDSVAAHSHFRTADRVYKAAPETSLHRSYVATQLAAQAVSQGDGDGALRLIAPHTQAARKAENAALLATLMMLRAEALELQTRPLEASSVRLDSLGWARYGFGPDWAVRAKLNEVASLNPRKG